MEDFIVLEGLFTSKRIQIQRCQAKNVIGCTKCRENPGCWDLFLLFQYENKMMQALKEGAEEINSNLKN